MEKRLIEIGNRLYAARNEYNVKQSYICDILGVSQSTYSRIESGETCMTIDVLIKLSEFYNVSVNWILGIDDDELKFTKRELFKIEEFKQYLINIRK